jgi:hypothetical protein
MPKTAVNAQMRVKQTKCVRQGFAKPIVCAELPIALASVSICRVIAITVENAEKFAKKGTFAPWAVVPYSASPD